MAIEINEIIILNYLFCRKTKDVLNFIFKNSNQDTILDVLEYKKNMVVI